jgi:YVTN family beta-propeller protein
MLRVAPFVQNGRSMKLGWHIGLSGLGVLGVAVACSASDASGTAGAPGGTNFDGTGAGAGANFTPGSGGASSGASTGGAPALPPEKETSTNFELPHAGESFVYAANPDSNTVAVIDATTLGIQTVEAGTQPKFLQTLGGTDAAIVLNVGSSDATIIRTSASGKSTTTRVDVAPGSNAIAVAPDGKHAIVYFDEAFSSPGSTPVGFQDANVITLVDGKDVSTGMSVGFRPSRVFFSSDSLRGFLVTEDGISILDLEHPENAPIAPLVALGNTGIDKTLDVSVTPDGHYALARKQDSSELRLVDLATGEIHLLDMTTVVGTSSPADSGAPPVDSGAPAADSGAPQGGDSGAGDAGPTAPPDAGKKPSPAPVPAPAPAPAPAGSSTVTDLDLSPAGDYALAVLRDRSTVVRLPIPGAFTNAALATTTTVPGELIGSVTISPEGKYALLYTTVVDTNERLTILDLAGTTKPHSYQLRKSIDSIVVAPDGATALVVHQRLAGDPNEAGIDPEVKLDREYGYSLVKLDTGFAKLQVTPAPLGPSALVPDGSRLFILFNAPGLSQVQRVDLRSFVVQTISLGSPPVSVGAVPKSQRVFVGQDHPDGRISFIDWNTGAVQSVTGFELNSRIRE